MSKTSNDHVWDYLTYYLNLPHAPNFAVLLSGPWGVGKTFLVKQFLAKHFGDQKGQYVYVSLYGLSSIEEIDDALLQAIFPIATGKLATVSQRVAKTALKYFNVDASGFNLKDFLSKFDAKVYVFDDLERFEGGINKILGYINQFVEHGAAKVILVANEQEIPIDEDYSRRREKLIGKTLHVRSSFDDAFSHFLSKIDDPDARAALKDHSGDVAVIYDQSKLDNLRILQQAIWDFERLYKVISFEHRKNKEAVSTILRLLFALSFEIKAGRISDQDLLTGRGMEAAVIARMRDKDERDKKLPMREAEARYSTVDIDDAVFSNDLLVDFLIRGIVDPDRIDEQLSASRFFVKVADEPAWRTVWHYFERTEDDFDKALIKMELQYAKREFVIEGEILHVLGLRLFLAAQGAINRNRQEVLEDGKKYIDDLYNSKRLPIAPTGTFSEVRFNGFGGLGIHDHDTPEYRELFNYLKASKQRGLEDTYVEKATDVLNELKRDVQQFFNRLTYSGSGGGEFASTPILTGLDPDDFLDALLSLHPTEQHVAMMALKARFENGRLERELSNEKSWVQQIRVGLLARAKEMKPMSRNRVERHVAWYIDPVLQSEDSGSSAENDDAENDDND
jgi:hypothetical protein